MKRVEADERVLVTTLTKRMSEDLSDYFADFGMKVKYLHSDIGTVEPGWSYTNYRHRMAVDKYLPVENATFSAEPALPVLHNLIEIVGSLPVAFPRVFAVS